MPGAPNSFLFLVVRPGAPSGKIGQCGNGAYIVHTACLLYYFLSEQLRKLGVHIVLVYLCRPKLNWPVACKTLDAHRQLAQAFLPKKWHLATKHEVHAGHSVSIHSVPSWASC